MSWQKEEENIHKLHWFSCVWWIRRRKNKICCISSHIIWICSLKVFTCNYKVPFVIAWFRRVLTRAPFLAVICPHCSLLWSTQQCGLKSWFKKVYQTQCFFNSSGRRSSARQRCGIVTLLVPKDSKLCKNKYGITKTAWTPREGWRVILSHWK